MEIERKYLVTGDFPVTAEGTLIKQGFLNRSPDRMVRVRMSGNRAFLTIKGPLSADGSTRFEWEREIGMDEAKKLFSLCEPGIIEKTRYEVDYRGQHFEVDIFHGENEGLIIAELELQEPDFPVELPAWCGPELTGKIEYYNTYLSGKPYKTWKK